MKTNRNGPTNLAKVCAKNDIPFIYIPTNYVFDGDKLNFNWFEFAGKIVEQTRLNESLAVNWQLNDNLH